MHGLAHVRWLARNNAWSNLRLHGACARLTHAEYVAKRTSFFPSLHETLTHLLLVDWYYLDGLLGGGRGYAVFDDLSQLTTAEQVAAAQKESDQQLIAFVDALRADDDLDRHVTLQRPDGGHVDRVGDILLHLSIHQIHHRGQVHAMLSGTDVKPPQLDEYFLAEDRVLADRELRAAGFSTG